MHTAQFIAGQLIRHGRVRRGSIGVGGQTVPLHPRLVRFFGLPMSRAIRVLTVEQRSPAHQAGVREGDLIIGYNEQTVGSVDELHRLLAETSVGSPSTVTVVRGTERLVLTIVPIEAASSVSIRAAS